MNFKSKTIDQTTILIIIIIFEGVRPTHAKIRCAFIIDGRRELNFSWCRCDTSFISIMANERTLMTIIYTCISEAKDGRLACLSHDAGVKRSHHCLEMHVVRCVACQLPINDINTISNLLFGMPWLVRRTSHFVYRFGAQKPSNAILLRVLSISIICCQYWSLASC